MTFRNPLVDNAGGLSFESIHSPNYVPGTTGWTINRDGTVEFNTLGGTLQVNNSGIFFYVPNAGTGNLRMSIATADGTDSYGNTYKRGLFVNQNQEWFTGNNSHTVTINPTGQLGPEILFTPSGFNATYHAWVDQANGRILFEPVSSSGDFLEINGGFKVTGGQDGSATFQGSEITYPVNSGNFTDYTAVQWSPPQIVSPASETIDVLITFRGHPSSTATHGITLAFKIVDVTAGNTVLWTPTGVDSGCLNQNDGNTASSQDQMLSRGFTVGRDKLAGTYGHTLKFIPTVRITSNATPNPHIATASMSVKASPYVQTTSSFT